MKKQMSVSKRNLFRKLNDRGGFNIVVVLIIAVVVLGIVFWVASGSFTNFTKSNFSKPESYLKYVEKKELLGENYSSVNKAYQNIFNQLDYSSNAIEEEFSFIVGERGERYIKMAKQLGADLSWLQSFGVEILLNSKDDDLQVKSSFSLNDQKVVSPEIILDMHNKLAYLGAAELSKEYLKFDLSEKISDEDFNEAKARFEKFKKAYPDSKEVNKLIEKYLDLVFAEVKNVEKSKKAELESDDVSQKCTELTVTLSEKDLKSIIKAVCNELSKDQNAKKILKDYLSATKPNVDADQVCERFQEKAEEVAGRIDDIEFNLEKVVIRLYLDKKSNVVGRIYEVQRGGEDPIIVKMIAPTDKNKSGFEISYQKGARKNSFEGTGKLKGNKLSGDYTLRINDTKVLNMEVKDFDLKALKDGNLKGHFVIKPSGDLDMDQLLSAFGINNKMISSTLALVKPGLDLKLDTGKTKSSMEIAVTDSDVDIFRIVCKVSTKKNSAIKTPSKTVDVTDQEAVNKFIDSLDWDKIDKTLDKANVPSAYLDALKRYLEKSTLKKYLDKKQ